MLQKLSNHIKSKGELRALAFTGLEIAPEKVQTHLQNNNNDISSAVYELLYEWRNAHEDAESAYEGLRKGLDKCNLEHYISAVLKPQ